MISASMARLATVTASVERNVSAGGKAPGTTEVIPTLMIMPLSILDAQTRMRVVIDTPNQLKQTFCQSDDILEIKNGYTLVIENAKYPIRDVGASVWQGGYRYQIVVEVLSN